MNTREDNPADWFTLGQDRLRGADALRSKLYKIGKLQRHDTLRDRIADARLFNLFKRRNGRKVQRARSSGICPMEK